MQRYMLEYVSGLGEHTSGFKHTVYRCIRWKMEGYLICSMYTRTLYNVQVF